MGKPVPLLLLPVCGRNVFGEGRCFFPGLQTFCSCFTHACGEIPGRRRQENGTLLRSLPVMGRCVCICMHIDIFIFICIDIFIYIYIRFLLLDRIRNHWFCVAGKNRIHRFLCRCSLGNRRKLRRPG